MNFVKKKKFGSAARKDEGFGQKEIERKLNQKPGERMQ
jgi:hypothetical protein